MDGDPGRNPSLVKMTGDEGAVAAARADFLHARWGGFAREKGLMAMAISGNVISLSWFGVNMPGVGLHSYGFMNSAFRALAVFIGAQLF